MSRMHATSRHILKAGEEPVLHDTLDAGQQKGNHNRDENGCCRQDDCSPGVCALGYQCLDRS